MKVKAFGLRWESFNLWVGMHHRPIVHLWGSVVSVVKLPGDCVVELMRVRMQA